MTDMVREDFEAWAKTAGWPHSWQYLNTDEFGFDSASWEVWQAATQRSAERIAQLEAQVKALSLDAGRLRVSQSRTGYMCLTDFQHELGEASGGISVYADEDDLKKHRNCWKGCGIMKVEVIANDAAIDAMKEKP